MQFIAFGRSVADPHRSAFEDVTRVLASLPRRYKHCEVEIAMRGSSTDYEDWVSVRVSAEKDELETSCVEWITKQVTRRGYAIVPRMV